MKSSHVRGRKRRPGAGGKIFPVPRYYMYRYRPSPAESQSTHQSPLCQEPRRKALRPSRALRLFPTSVIFMIKFRASIRQSSVRHERFRVDDACAPRGQRGRSATFVCIAGIAPAVTSNWRLLAAASYQQLLRAPRGLPAAPGGTSGSRTAAAAAAIRSGRVR